VGVRGGNLWGEGRRCEKEEAMPKGLNKGGGIKRVDKSRWVRTGKKCGATEEKKKEKS